MRRNTLGWFTIGALLLLFCSAGTASAMSAFSRKYKMQCDGCHTSRIPELNEFGIEFYKNGFTIPDKEGKTAGTGGQQGGGAAKAPAGTERTTARPEGKAPATEGAAKDDQEDEDEYEEPPPKKEVPPTVVYRSKSSDGTVFFTDTPERRTDFLWKQDNGEGEPGAVRGEKTVPPKRRKPATSRQQGERPAVESARVVKKERFRNYEECMERQLIGAKQPESGQEMMDLMMAAEKACAGYPLERR